MKRVFVLTVAILCLFMASAASESVPPLTQDVSYGEATFLLQFRLPDGWEETALVTSVSYNDGKWVYEDSGNNIALVIACDDLWISSYRADLWAALSDSDKAALPDERATYGFQTAGILKKYMDRFASDYQQYSPSITTEDINGVVHIVVRLSIATAAGNIGARIDCAMVDGVFYGFTFTTPYSTAENWQLIEAIVGSAVYEIL